MPMSNGWTTPMMWMRMPGETWPGAAVSFVAMWIAMMVPMMLPAVAPELWRHRVAAARSGAGHPAALTTVAGAGYFFVWAVVGLAAFPLGASLAHIVMEHAAFAREMPIAGGVTVTIAGFMQLTPWKARHLGACRWKSCSDASRPADAASAWREGVRLGLRCAASCANLMLIPLIVGAMDVGAMAAVGTAIAAERLAPRGERVARLTGVIVAAAGLLLITRAIGA